MTKNSRTFVTGLLLLSGWLAPIPAAPEPQPVQEKNADVVAWCSCEAIKLLEKPSIQEGVSSQLRRFSFRIDELLKGELPQRPTFTIEYAEYEVHNTRDLEDPNAIEVLIQEIHGRPRIEVGKQYKVYLRRIGDGVEPINGRWSVLEARVDPDLREKWMHQPISKKDDAKTPAEPPGGVSPPPAPPSQSSGK